MAREPLVSSRHRSSILAVTLATTGLLYHLGPEYHHERHLVLFALLDWTLIPGPILYALAMIDILDHWVVDKFTDRKPPERGHQVSRGSLT